MDGCRLRADDGDGDVRVLALPAFYSQHLIGARRERVDYTSADYARSCYDGCAVFPAYTRHGGPKAKDRPRDRARRRSSDRHHRWSFTVREHYRRTWTDRMLRRNPVAAAHCRRHVACSLVSEKGLISGFGFSRCEERILVESEYWAELEYLLPEITCHLCFVGPEATRPRVEPRNKPIHARLQ